MHQGCVTFITALITSLFGFLPNSDTMQMSVGSLCLASEWRLPETKGDKVCSTELVVGVVESLGGSSSGMMMIGVVVEKARL